MDNKEILKKAKEFANKKKQAMQGNKTIKKTVMPNGNIHFEKE